MTEVLEEFISKLKKLTDPSPDSVVSLIEASGVKEQDLLPFAHFDHDVADSYGRKVLFSRSDCQVFVMSWCPDDFSAIHDHGNLKIAYVIPYGELVHNTYKYQDGELKELNSVSLEPGKSVSVAGKMIHQMGNRLLNPALSLHVYFFEGPEEDSRVFDVVNKKVLHTSGGAFYQLSKELIKSEEGGLLSSDKLFQKEKERDEYRARLINQPNS